MTTATAWAALAAEERKRHRRAWGSIQEKNPSKPKKQTGRTVGTYNPERLALIKKLIGQGMNNAEVARAIGVSESSIRYWRVKYNIQW
jgi:transposase-like protein